MSSASAEQHKKRNKKGKRMNPVARFFAICVGKSSQDLPSSSSSSDDETSKRTAPPRRTIERERGDGANHDADALVTERKDAVNAPPPPPSPASEATEIAEDATTKLLDDEPTKTNAENGGEGTAPNGVTSIEQREEVHIHV